MTPWTMKYLKIVQVFPRSFQQDLFDEKIHFRCGLFVEHFHSIMFSLGQKNGTVYNILYHLLLPCLAVLC